MPILDSEGDIDGFEVRWGYFQPRSFHAHLYPHFAVAWTRLSDERGNVPTRGYDELGKAGEGNERRIKLRFQSLGAVECDSRMHNHTRWL